MKQGLLALTHASATTKFRSPLLVAALVALAVTACSKQEEPKPAAAPAPAPIATAAAPAAPAAPAAAAAPADATPAAAAPASAAPAAAASAAPAAGSGKQPNIILILSDDFGYGDSGPYGGGEGRGMPTPSLDRLSKEGMTFYSFYAQPSCTPGRAAVQTGRIPNRSGMTTVAFQGQGGGLPKAEWTLASVLKQGGYQTFFTGKWHLGEADYALPTAQGYDEMKYVGLYHLNAYTYADPTWF
ncbi:MAG: sulfatase-like hydrolase/transferase, partial [Dechloromonas sp.]|nr:sulfatase-like hydrolase/transferase [Dechloromonas sp.]